jgi:sulfite oxidase
MAKARSSARLFLSSSKHPTLGGVRTHKGATQLRQRAFASSNAHATPPAQSRVFRYVVIGLAVTACIGLGAFSGPALHAEAPSPPDSRDTTGQRSSLKIIRLSEVHEHDENAERKWVTKGNKVYDITEWIPNHPGGEVILRAVGGSIDRYWDIFAIHKKDDVYDILEQYCIGQIDPQDLQDGRVPSADIDDPFETDPQRDPRLKHHTNRPCNAETANDDLQPFITANEVFYVRNHLWVPGTDETKKQTLTIEMPDGEEREYSVEDLKKKFKEVEITATLQCSGNRRSHMNMEARSTQGLPWGVGAISNAEWTGVRLRDVLADAGFPVDDWPEDVKHVQFGGAEAYGASIPIEKATDRRGDVIVAYKMNGVPLPPDHGAPIRMIVPGYVAARSVKWVNKIILSDEESPSQWQKRDYKVFGPNVQPPPNWDAAPAIQETPVQSAITSLHDISSANTNDRRMLQVYGLEEDSVVVEGYAYAGGGRKIVRVDISPNDGRTWHQAELLQHDTKGSKAWAWQKWRFVLPKIAAGRCFVVKAVDEASNVQPEQYEPHYNFRGNLTSSWHRVGYQAQK